MDHQLKLISLLNNDAFLRGSVELEGANFEETIVYLAHFLEHAPESIVPASMLAVMNKVQKLCFYSKKITDIKNGVQGADEALLASQIREELLDSHPIHTEKEKTPLSVLIPGGWAGSPATGAGHAMIYEFKRDNDELFFTVYNSGAGLSYHAKQLHKNELRYCPTLTYKLPIENLWDRAFPDFINELIALQVKPHLRKQNERYFYEKCLPSLHYFGGKIINPTPEELENTTSGQISGTCAQRVLHQLIKNCFQTRDAYLRFMYQYKVFAVDEYFETLDQNLEEIQNPGVNHQLKLAAENLLSLLNQKEEDTEKPLFSTAFKTKESKKLFEYLEKLQTAPLIINVDTPPNATPVVDSLLDFPKQRTQTEIESLKSTSITFSQLILPSIQADSCLLDTLISIEGQLSDETKHYTEAEIIEKLEFFFSHIPLPNDYNEPVPALYQAVVSNTKDREAVYALLTKIDYIYKEALYTTKLPFFFAETLPQASFTHLNILSMVNYVEQKSQPELVFPENYLSHLDEILRDVQSNNVHIYSPYTAQRIKAIEKLHSTRPKVNIEEIDYLQNILIQYGKDQIKSLQNDFADKKAEDFSEALLNKNHYELKELERLKNLVGESQVKKWDFRALYYVIQNRDEAAFIQKYPELSRVFKNIQNFESVYQKLRGIAGPGFQINENLFSYSGHSSARLKTPERVHSAFKSSLRQSETDFFSKLLSENTLQTISYMDPSNSCALRMFLTKKYQIPLSLDFYQQHLELLADPKHQAHLECMLFQNALLETELSNERAALFLAQFKNLIQKGMDFYIEQGELTLTNLYLIRLMYQVYSYAAFLNPERYTPDLIAFKTYIEQTLAKTTSSKLLNSLNAYPSLIATQLEDSWDNSEAILFVLKNYLLNTQAIKEVFNTEKMPTGEVLSVAVTIERLKRQQIYIRQLEAHQSLLTESLLEKVISQIMIEIPAGERHLNGQFPTYTLYINNTLYASVNLTTGLISDQSGYVYKALPQNLKAYSLFQYLGIKPPSLCFMSLDGSIVNFEHNGIAFRLIKEEYKDQAKRVNYGYTLYAKWSDAWYQAARLSDKQGTDLNLNTPVLEMKQIPATIKASNAYLAWVKCPNDTDAQPLEILFTQGIKTAFITHLSTSTTHTLDAPQSILHAENHPLFDLFNRFEPATWINVLENTQTHAFEIQLPRHKLSFHSQDPNAAVYWEWNDKPYGLQKKPKVFQHKVAHLVFENKNNEQVCILAIHPFKPNLIPSPFSEYYGLQHDIYNSPFDSQVGEKTPSFFCYSVKKDKLIPATAEEALYLAYVYLADEKPEHAWEVLQDCQQRLNGLTGGETEVLFIQWIILHLPDTQYTKPSSAQTPEVVACQLKALAMLAACDFEETQSAGAKSESNTINPFKSAMFNLFLLHEQMNPQADIAFQLSEDEKMSVLRYSTNHSEIMYECTLHTPLDYAYARTSLSQLKKEWGILENKAKTQALSDYDKIRKGAIENWCKNHPGFKLISDELDEEHHVSLSITEADFEQVKHSTENLRRLIVNTLADIFYPHTYKDIYYAVAKLRENPHRTESEMKKMRRSLENIIICFENTFIPEEVITKTICKAIVRHLAQNKIPSNDELYFPWRSDKPECNYHFINWISDALKLPEPPLITSKFRPSANHLLASIQEEWALLPAYEPIVIPSLNENLLQLDKGFHNDLSQSWQAALKDWSTTLKALIPTSEDAQQQAEAKIAALKCKQALSQRYFGSDEVCSTLAIEIDSIASQCEIEAKALEAEILTLANKRFELLENKVASKAKKAKPLDMKALLSLYFHQDQARYQSICDLSEEDIKTLHSFLTQYVHTQLKLQQAKRVKLKLKERLNTQDPLNQEEANVVLANTLFAINPVDVKNDTLISYFQMQSDLLLRDDQAEAIQRLLSLTKNAELEPHYQECIEKMIMGGGKSKVLLPILAAKKASGERLLVIEVPHDLISVNHKDLHTTSKLLFNQTAHIFNFSRRSDCSAEKLEKIFNLLNQTMLNKDYLVTSAQSLQALELKYLEFLSKPKNENKEWEAQVLWAEKILLLLKNKGDLLIDEVHQSLDIKRKFRYAIGDRTTVEPHLINATLDFFGFLAKVGLTESLSLNEVISYPKLFNDTNLKTRFRTHIARQLLEHDDSPLREFIKQYPSLEASLLAYLQNESDELLDAIKDFPMEIKDGLALYKEQISTFAPLTLPKVYGENYGPSRLQQRPLLSRLISIPYAGNNNPNEYSRFGQLLEEMNYTIQGLCTAGIPIQMLQDFLIEKQAIAKKEFVENYLDNINEAPTHRLFNRILVQAGIDASLSQINFKDKSHFNSIYPKLNKNMDLILMCAQRVLEQIRLDPFILYSDVLTKISSVHTAQGLTGTPENASTYHERLHFDSNHALGTNEYILERIKEKNPRIRGCDFDDLDSFLEQIFKEEDKKLHAIIDINATFHGIENLAVVQALAKVFKEKKPAIRYILFFNADNQFCAYDLKKNASQTPIFLTSSNSDSILAQLHCDLSECFTYYSQRNTTGVDIKQLSDANAAVLIDQDLCLSNFLQGIMRMRNLVEGHQNIHLFMPQKDASKSLDELTVRFKQNEVERIQTANFESLLLKMNECIRNDLLKRIYASPSPESKAKQFESYKAFFIEENSSSFFLKHAAINKEISTQHLIEQHQTQLMERWRSLVQTNQTEEKEMLTQLMNIGNKVKKPGFCNQTYKAHQHKLGTQQEIEKQAQQQIQQALQTEDRQEEARYRDVKEAIYRPWQGSSPFSDESSELELKTLHQICWDDEAQFEFSHSIYASKNFYMSMLGKPVLSKYLKSVFGLLFTTNPLKCVLLSQEELRDLKTPLPGGSWVSTTSHTPLIGNIPKEILSHPLYQSMIEQIRFFNGELSLLIPSSEKINWLKEKTEEKMDFLREKLMPIRGLKKEQVEQLKVRLYPKSKSHERVSFFEMKTKTHLKHKTEPSTPTKNSKGQTSNP